MSQIDFRESQTKCSLAEQIRDTLLKLAKFQTEIGDLQENLTDALLALEADSQKNAKTPAAPHESLAEVAETGYLDETVNLEKWLSDRDISIKQRRPQNPFDESFDRLATFLGRHFEDLRDFYAALKKRVGGSPYPQTLSLQNLLPNQISSIVQFGQDLHRNSFLKEFRYIKRKRLIVFGPQDDGRVTNFFTGGWLERYVMLATFEHFKKQSSEIAIEVLTNPRVVLPDGEDFELDILLANGSTVLWFECKTGKNFPAYVSKYGAVAKNHMQMDPKNAALVLLEDLTPEEKANNSQFAAMSVLNLRDLNQFLKNLTSRPDEHELDDSHLSTPDTVTLRPSANPSDVSQFGVLLRRSGLRPLVPKERRRIIKDLLAVQARAGEPIPLRDLVTRLKTQYDVDNISVSKSKINDISTALIRSGCCERGSHSDYENDVWFLSNGRSAENCFDACSQLYLWTWLKATGSMEFMRENSLMLAQTLWGQNVHPDDALAKIKETIDELICRGQCNRQKNDGNGQTVVRAQGDRFIE